MFHVSFIFLSKIRLFFSQINIKHILHTNKHKRIEMEGKPIIQQEFLDME